MVRPKRLYKTKKDGNTRYYYLIKGKKRYIKVPEGVSQKQVVKINIKNVAPEGRRIKRRKKRVRVKYEKPIVDGMKKAEITQGAKTQLPVYFFQPQRQVPSIPDQTKPANIDKTKPVKIEELKGDDLKVINKAIEDSKKENRELLYLLYQELKPQPAVKELPLPEVEETGRISPMTETSVEAEESGGEEKSLTAEEEVPPPLLLGDEEEEEEVEEAPTILQDTKVILRELLGKTFTKDDFRTLNKRKPIISQLKLKYPSYKEGDINTKTLKSFKGTLNSFYSKQQGKGASINKGLYNDEIGNVLKKRIKDFVPVIPLDKVKDMVKYIKPQMKRFGFIVNTNPSTSDGSGNDGYKEGHWRSVYFNNEDDFKSAEYFDPLAEGNPEPELLEGMKMIARKMNPENYFLFKVNNLKRQPDGTASCGWHSIKFLDDRYQGVGWDDATGYNDYMDKHRPDDSKDGERDVKNYFEKYKSYI
jgi:hypothetical protein